MVVVLPAPFGPRKPKTSPFSMLRVRLSTAVRLPKVRVRFSVLIVLGRHPCLFGLVVGMENNLFKLDETDFTV